MEVLAWVLDQARDRTAVVNARTVRGMTPMDIACYRGHVHVCDFLETQCGASAYTAPKDLDDKDAVTTMHTAAYGGSLEVCAWLAERDPTGGEAFATAATGAGATPLHAAAVGQQARCVEWLLSHGALGQVNWPDPDGETALHHACASGCLAVVDALLVHSGGAVEESLGVASHIQGGRLPMLTAWEGRHLAVCARILEAVDGDWVRACGGVEVSARRFNAADAWVMAIDAGSVDQLDWLRSQGAGAFITSTGALGRSPVHAASVGRYLESAEWLFRHFGDRFEDWEAAQLFYFLTSVDLCETAPLSAACEAVLWQRGPCVVQKPIVGQLPAKLLEIAVRVGVELQFLKNQPQTLLGGALLRAVLRRRHFVSVVLFGCRRSSGSTCLWKIGSVHAMGGIRKAVAEFCGVVVDAGEWRRVRRVLRDVGGSEGSSMC